MITENTFLCFYRKCFPKKNHYWFFFSAGTACLRQNFLLLLSYQVKILIYYFYFFINSNQFGLRAQECSVINLINQIVSCFFPIFFSFYKKWVFQNESKSSEVLIQIHLYGHKNFVAHEKRKKFTRNIAVRFVFIVDDFIDFTKKNPIHFF